MHKGLRFVRRSMAMGMMRMSNTMEQLKEIKGLLAAMVSLAVVCMAVGGAIMEWRISANVAIALSSQDLGTDAKIVSMDTSIAANKAASSMNAVVIADNKKRVEKAFDVLLNGE